jgi:phosphoglycolate phosphatase-like HAD superfamily hydrolase
MVSTKKPAVIFDMDGTLCDVTSVRHHILDRRRRNYHAFHYGSSFCPPIDWVADAARNYQRNGFEPLIVTARRRMWRTLTVNWLETHEIPFTQIYMRAQDDDRKDKLVKSDILDLILESYDVKHAFDDNPSIIELWRERDIPHTVVPGWAEEYING